MRVRTGKPITVKNLVLNATFSGTVNWTAYRSTLSAPNVGYITVTKAETDYASCYQDMSNLVVGHKYFYMIEMMNVSGATSISYTFQNGGTGYYTKTVSSPVAGVWYNFTGGGTASGTTSRIDPMGAGASGAKFAIRKPIVIDLTDAFGSGKEPSPQEFYEKYASFLDAIVNGQSVIVESKSGKASLGPKEAESDLPVDYKEVEYIESSGAQYIDTGFKPTKNTDVSLETLYTVANNAYQGVYQYMGISMRGGTSVTDYVYSNAYYSHAFTNAINTRYSVEFRHVDHGLYIDGTQIFTQSTVSNIAPANFYLFAVSNSDSSAPTTAGRFASCRLYSCRIADDGVPIRDFVPCIRRSDAKPGLYDKVEGRFYVNQGAGADFTYALFPYEFVDYVYAEGGQYIDTGIIPDTTTKIEMKVKATQPLYRCGISGYGYFHTDGGYYKFDGSSGTLNSNIPLSTVATCSVDYSDNKVRINDYEGTATINLSGNSKTFYLLNRNGALVTSVPGSTAYLYWSKIYSNGNLVRDFVPAIRKSDYKPGMYDKVSRKLFTNMGTGEFIAPKYVPVEYIQSSGTQYVDTGLKLDQFDDVEATFSFPTLPNSIVNLCGSRNGAGVAISHLRINANNQIEPYFGNFLNSGVTLSANGDYTVRCKGVSGSQSVYVDGEYRAGTTIAYSTAGDLTCTIFGLNTNDGVSFKGAFRLSRFKILKNGTPIRYYVPCIRKPDNKPGLYDRITKEFLTNKGTGEFSYGYRNPFDAYQRVQYIESTGTQWIDTGLIGQSGYTLEAEVSYNEVSTGAYQYFAGFSYTGSANRVYYFRLNNSSPAYGYTYGPDNSTTTNLYTMSPNTWYKCKAVMIDGNQQCWVDDVLRGTSSFSLSGVDVTNPKYIYMFATQYIDHTNYPAKCKCKYAKWYFNGKLVRDFIPCYRKSDGEVGLWDAVTSTFYGNSGTGVFLRGPEVNVAKTMPVETMYGYNQKCDNGDFSRGMELWSVPSWSPISLSVYASNGGLTMKADDDSTDNWLCVQQNLTPALKRGHTYLVKASKLASKARTNSLSIGITNSTVLSYVPYDADVFKVVWAIVRLDTDADHYLQLFGFPYNGSTASGDEATYKNVQCIDLTEWFGIGKEPTSVEEFTAKFHRNYYGYVKDPIRLTERQINNKAKLNFNQLVVQSSIRQDFYVDNRSGSDPVYKNMALGTSSYRMQLNHKYILLMSAPVVKSGNVWLYLNTVNNQRGIYHTFDDPSNVFTVDSIEANSRGYIYFNIRPGATCSFHGYIMLIDMTEMFGEGNEPSTVSEFKSLFPHGYYPYCAGSKLNRAQINAIAKD